MDSITDAPILPLLFPPPPSPQPFPGAVLDYIIPVGSPNHPALSILLSLFYRRLTNLPKVTQLTRDRINITTWIDPGLSLHYSTLYFADIGIFLFV